MKSSENTGSHFLSALCLTSILLACISCSSNSLWIEKRASYFDEIPQQYNSHPDYPHFLMSVGDINGDNLADVVWMWKQNPFDRGREFGFEVTYPAFSINYGTFEEPEWLFSSANWGFWNLKEKPGQVTVPVIVDWNGDGFGDIFVGERDVDLKPNYGEALYPPFYLDLADPEATALIQGTSCQSHIYFQFHGDMNSYEKIKPLLIENFPLNPLWPSSQFHHASPSVYDLDGDGDLDIIAGQNYDPYKQGYPSPTGWGRIVFFINNGKTWELVVPNLPLFDCEQIDIWESDGFELHEVSPPYRLRKNLSPHNYRQRANPAAGDLDGDGLTELLVGTVCGRVFCFKNIDPGNCLLWKDCTVNYLGSIKTADCSASYGKARGGNTRPSLFDFDFDGDLDLYIYDEQGMHMYLNKTAPALIKVKYEGMNNSDSMKWSIKNLTSKKLILNERLRGFYNDNHPYPNVIYEKAGLIDPDAKLSRVISVKLPGQSRGNRVQKFYFEVEVTGSADGAKIFKAKSLAFAEMNAGRE